MYVDSYTASVRFITFLLDPFTKRTLLKEKQFHIKTNLT